MTVSAAVCGFPVLVEPVVNKEVVTIFSDGRVHVTGALVGRLTNTSNTSKSIVVNISGPTHISPEGTFKATGNWLFFQEPNALAPSGMLLLTSGQVFLTFGADPTTFTLEQKGGTQTDVCDLLA